MSNAFIARAQRIANKCREVKGWKPGSLFARAEKENTGSLYVYSVIGSSWWEEGVTATGVKDALAALKGVKTLNVFINSEGGDVFEAKAIYAQLKRFDAEVIVHIDGIAASAATFIAMAGNKIITSPAATWMVHEAWTFAMGDATSLRDTADLLDMLNDDIALIYATRAGRPVDEMRQLMRATTWMNAEQALKEKFTDEIASYDEGDEEDDKAAATKNTSKLEAAATATQQRIAASTAELLNFKNKRAQLEAPKEPIRTSAVKQRPASR